MVENAAASAGSGTPTVRRDVVVQDGRIADVWSGLDGDQVIDVAGQPVLPGFFDCHGQSACRAQ